MSPVPMTNFTPPAWLMEAIEEVMASKVSTFKAPPTRFDLSEDSVQHNTDLLKGHDLDMENLLSSYQVTTLGFGSEFRPVDQLQTMLGQHPNFDCFSDVISDGMEHHFTENISEDKRTAELEAMIDRGNHQSVMPHATERESPMRCH